MLKFVMIIVACVCTTVVVSETTALIVLWQRGVISGHHLREIQLVLMNRTADDKADDEKDDVSEFPSAQQMARARAVKTLNFDKRESELVTLKEMADGKRDDLETQQKQLRAQRKAFEEELAQIEATLTAASTEQARGVLLALPPKDAVRQLMQLSLTEEVVLLKGMPEKNVARILKEFSATVPTTTVDASGEKKETPAERGRKIFEALSRGEPTRSILDQTRKSNEPDPTDSS